MMFLAPGMLMFYVSICNIYACKYIFVLLDFVFEDFCSFVTSYSWLVICNYCINYVLEIS